MYTYCARGGRIYSVEFYRTQRGDCPIRDLLESLTERVRARVAAWIGLLEEKGPELRRPYADVLEDAIRELRISIGRLEVRLLYFIHGKHIVLTHGFLKKTRAVPREEIERAKRCRVDWMSRFGGGD